MDEFSTTFTSITPNEPSPVPFVHQLFSTEAPESGDTIVTLQVTI